MMMMDRIHRGRSACGTLMLHWKLFKLFCLIFNCTSGWVPDSLNVEITEGRARVAAWEHLASYVPEVFVEAK